MIVDFIVIILATFSISSMWLYSPGPEKIRDIWMKYAYGLQPLAYCQLCCSFWIGLALHSFMLGFDALAIIMSFVYAGVSWLLGAIANFCLWGGYWFKKQS